MVFYFIKYLHMSKLFCIFAAELVLVFDIANIAMRIF